MVTFDDQKTLIFMKSNTPIFSFMVNDFCVLFNKALHQSYENILKFFKKLVLSLTLSVQLT